MKVRKLRNLIGPQVRRIRWQKNWSQEELTNKLQDLGWNICRQRLARIESCEACVSDFEIIIIAAALGIEVKQLLPRIEASKPLYAVLAEMMDGQIKSLMSPDQITFDRSVILCSTLPEPPQNHFVQNCGQKVSSTSSNLSLRENMNATVLQNGCSVGISDRLAYSIYEAADLLGVHYFSVYWLVQREKLQVCRALPAQMLIPRSELLKLLNTE